MIMLLYPSGITRSLANNAEHNNQHKQNGYGHATTISTPIHHIPFCGGLSMYAWPFSLSGEYIVAGTATGDSTTSV
jgi:hypothetical protein